jgi:tRNA (guanine37-N1)-methyltransferase
MKTEKSKGIKIKHIETEKTRKFLIRKKLIRSDLKIKKDEKYCYIPIKKIIKEIKNFEIVEKKFEKQKEKYFSYKDYLNFPDNIKKKLPNSYDIIGEIILIKLPSDSLKYKNLIGAALIKTNKNIKTVCLIDPVSGELRTRNLSIISGDKNTSTIHNEFGIKYYINLSKAYFSPRLANERKRISKLVKNNEIIVDLFAGVGPFSIMIAKYANPKKIYLIDKNKYAIKYAKKNILINNVLDKINILNIDAKNIERYILKNKLKADRVIMNLPFSAFNYFENALKILADNAFIHYYDILKNEKINDRINYLKRISEKNGFKIKKFKIRKIKSYSPREFYIGIDITAKKIADVA